MDFAIGEKKLLTKRADISLVIGEKRYIIEVKVDKSEEELKESMKKYAKEADVVIGILWDRKKDEVLVRKISDQEA